MKNEIEFINNNNKNYSNLKEKEILNLNNVINNLKNVNLKDLNDENIHLKNDINNKNKQILDLTNNYTKEYNILNKSYINLKSEYDNLLSEFNLLKYNKLPNLTKLLNNVEDQLENNNFKLKNIEEECNEKDSLISKLNDKISVELEGKVIKNLKNNLNEYKEIVNNLNIENNQMKEINENLNKTIEENLKLKLDNLETTLKKLNNEIKDLNDCNKYNILKFNEIKLFTQELDSQIEILLNFIPDNKQNCLGNEMNISDNVNSYFNTILNKILPETNDNNNSDYFFKKEAHTFSNDIIKNLRFIFYNFNIISNSIKDIVLQNDKYLKQNGMLYDKVNNYVISDGEQNTNIKKLNSELNEVNNKYNDVKYKLDKIFIEKEELVQHNKELNEEVLYINEENDKLLNKLNYIEKEFDKVQSVSDIKELELNAIEKRYKIIFKDKSLLVKSFEVIIEYTTDKNLRYILNEILNNIDYINETYKEMQELVNDEITAKNELVNIENYNINSNNSQYCNREASKEKTSIYNLKLEKEIMIKKIKENLNKYDAKIGINIYYKLIIFKYKCI